MDDMKLTVPQEVAPADAGVAVCEEIIEVGISDVRAIRQGRTARVPSYRGALYDEGYAQGRKDAARVILRELRGREHVTSDDVTVVPVEEVTRALNLHRQNGDLISEEAVARALRAAGVR